MESIDKKIDLVNKAIEINNDRIAGYEKATEIIEDTEMPELATLFLQYKTQSEQFNTELAPFVKVYGGTPEEGTMLSGKLFRIWMDIKSLISPYTPKAVLQSCEKGEDEFRNAYKELIDESFEDCPDISEVLQSQFAQQGSAHTHIKELRDSA